MCDHRVIISFSSIEYILVKFLLSQMGPGLGPGPGPGRAPKLLSDTQARAPGPTEAQTGPRYDKKKIEQKN